MAFKDHFSGHADIYRDARPLYPAALFEWIARQAPGTTRVWDRGCGNGQASIALADHFDAVYASDPSATQIAAAQAHPRVSYHVEPAERTTLADASVAAVTVAQALHWFDFERFYAQVRRVLQPGGLIAVWTYADCTVSPAIDALKNQVYVDRVGPYWPPERRHVEAGYADLPFPFTPLEAPPFVMQVSWRAAQFAAYLRSWSASQRYLAATGEDAVGSIEPALHAAWGDGLRDVHWQLALRAGRAV